MNLYTKPLNTNKFITNRCIYCNVTYYKSNICNLCSKVLYNINQLAIITQNNSDSIKLNNEDFEITNILLNLNNFDNSNKDRYTPTPPLVLKNNFYIPQNKKIRRKKCNSCINCLQKDCGNCIECLDKPALNGLGKRKKLCKYKKKCLNIN